MDISKQHPAHARQAATYFILKHLVKSARQSFKKIHLHAPKRTKQAKKRSISPQTVLAQILLTIGRNKINSPTWTKKFNQWVRKHPQKRKVKMIKPLADRIVVKPAEAEQKTSSGLFIPDNAKEKPMQGKVVAVGPGRKNDKGELVAMEVKVGDVVLYGKYSGTEVSVDGENYLIVKESDIFATL